MKVIWDDLGRSIKLIVCAMGNYYLASIWIKEKAQIQSYSLKESIIVLIGMMFFIGLFGVAVTVELLLRRQGSAASPDRQLPPSCIATLSG